MSGIPDTAISADVAQSLARAHAFVEHARVAADQGLQLTDLALGMRCFEVAYLLIDAGAIPSAELLSEPRAGTPGQLLTAAAEALDAIAEDDRPVGLLTARVALATAQTMASE